MSSVWILSLDLQVNANEELFTSLQKESWDVLLFNEGTWDTRGILLRWNGNVADRIGLVEQELVNTYSWSRVDPWAIRNWTPKVPCPTPAEERTIILG